jgi:hypothetical protein
MIIFFIINLVKQKNVDFWLMLDALHFGMEGVFEIYILHICWINHFLHPEFFCIFLKLINMISEFFKTVRSVEPRRQNLLSTTTPWKLVKQSMHCHLQRTLTTIQRISCIHTVKWTSHTYPIYNLVDSMPNIKRNKESRFTKFLSYPYPFRYLRERNHKYR